jgi:copper oxidase (laccase) domain-containing protein
MQSKYARRGRTTSARAPTRWSPIARACCSAWSPPTCAPVLLADRAAGWSRAHAGWRGAHGGVLESTLAAMDRLGARRERVVAAVGRRSPQPSYEVDAGFRENFSADDERFFAAGREATGSSISQGYVARPGCRGRVGTVATARPPAARYLCRRGTRFYSFRRATHREASRPYGANSR